MAKQTPADVLMARIATMQEAINIMQNAVNNMTGSINPDTATWADLGIGEKEASLADTLVHDFKNW